MDEVISPTEGVDYPELTPFEGKRGLREIRRVIERLTAEREELSGYLARWPEPSTRHVFRYAGPP